MKKDAVPKPTEAELEILQILWKHGPCTVRFVNDKLNQKKTVGYTTTLKIMQLMFEKKLLKRDETTRSHLYSAAVKEKETQGLLLDRFLETAFGGSALKLVMQALGNHKASKEEISQIRELLDNLEGEKK
ncbi:MAG: BlaI/MecI/CopY family transcriptional regulator [Candidatus Aminicenantes bacterium]|nr:BlaI/MecI/CopY family transcriptional regulator [Candidatus Aminicenantes bacterium]NIM80643.1 BlaI/MecI/CopY family transcriptional regulator [Candidatus Aminicenantes bacterium]NIN20024.1 BlaI/MecI/CopY family transcriptional regulator [Candidatus Aminicenantes bacterium]NIN43812.1 BlaI/MecI/CopY family transcriptional regulator [Candidatus Aminicenantes bacterium]NIN86622.1 BlaI/MecI/CopY family transcriptional regulator [Candidatus Aminicenantes bacterium]